MRKALLLSILLALFLPAPVWAAIGSSCVWEFRTSGSNNNGGGYTSGGTDYSQQDAAQLNPTDLAMTQSSTTLTSATGGFTAAMIGNIIQITAGSNFDTGWYEITAYTDTNTVTLDRTAASGGNGSGGTGYVGGCLALPTDAFFEQVPDGNTVYVKAGTYTWTARIEIENDGSDLLPITVEGYNSSRDDDPVGDNRPLFACGGYDMYWGSFFRVENIRFTSSDRYGVFSPGNTLYVNLKSDGSGDAHGFSMGAQGNILVKCEATSAGAEGFINNATCSHYLFCYAHDCGSHGFQMYANSAAIGCVSADNASHGFHLNPAELGLIVNCVAYNNGTGIDTNDAFNIACVNNILDANTTGASADSNYKVNYWDYNVWDNTTDTSNVDKGPNAITSDPAMTDPANEDFTVGSGSNVIDAGMKISSDVGVAGTYKWNIGVDQDDNSGGGSLIDGGLVH
jgi:hypothetical protein